jgi:hypothetical protein
MSHGVIGRVMWKHFHIFNSSTWEYRIAARTSGDLISVAIDSVELEVY